MSEIVITRSDQGKTVEAHQNDAITLRLEENPTTGYRWEVELIDDRIIELIDSDYRTASGAGVGGGGMRIFRFRTKLVGTMQLKLRLRRAWEPEDAALDRFEITIRVQAS